MMKPLLENIDTAIDACLTLLICNRLAPICPTAHADDPESAQRYREFCEKMGEERSAAIKIISEQRDLLVPEMEKRQIDSSALFEIDFLVSYADPDEAQRMARRFERIYVALSRLETMCEREEEKPLGTRRPRGRPRSPEAERKQDEMVARAWETGNFPKYRDLARELNRTEREIKRAIDRHRKR